MIGPVPREGLHLDIVVARRTPVFWYEAVAIVAAAAAALTETHGPEAHAPDLGGIRIDAEGRVTVQPGGRHGESSAARLARTLHALVSSGGTPAPLRLLISKWIGTSDGGTVEEFAAELAYFVRPDPASVIRAVYQRCLAMPTEAARPEAAPPVPAPQPAKPRPRNPRRLLLGAAAAVSAAAAAGTWVAGGLPPWTGTLASFEVRALSDIVGSIRLQGVDSSQPARSERAAPATLGSTAPRPAVDASRALPARAPLSRDLPVRALAATATLSDARPTSARVPVPQSAPLSLPVYDSVVRVAATVEDHSARVYSIADGEIEPPSMLFPQLPPPLYAGEGAVNSMEVIVSETGTVERVRLVSRPQRMTDMMLLSGAKTWKFTPASLDGEPVRYKMIVNWAATP
jgi:hypothetical protein